MAVCRHRRVTKTNTQLPVAYLTCNFTPASEGLVILFITC